MAPCEHHCVIGATSTLDFRRLNSQSTSSRSTGGGSHGGIRSPDPHPEESWSVLYAGLPQAGAVLWSCLEHGYKGHVIVASC